MVVAAPLSPPNEADAERTEEMCRLATPGTPGKAFDDAVQQCVASDSPNLAYWETCRRRGRSQHLTGEALSDDVASCMSQEP